MYRHILAATDGSEVAANAVKQAGALAGALRAKLTIVTVTPSVFSYLTTGYMVSENVVEKIEEANRNQAKSVLDNALALVGSVEAATVHATNALPYEGILQTAQSIAADLIVMASHGRTGLNKLIVGSQAAKILSMAQIPVLIVK